MTFEEFENKYGIQVTGPTTVNSGTPHVRFNVHCVDLVDRQTGDITPTKLVISDPAPEGFC